jgi:hypothetical protein
MFWKVRLSHLNYFNLPVDRLQDYQPEMHQLLDELDSFYISAKLKYSAELYSRTTIRQEQYKMPLLEDILTLLKQEKDINPTVKKLYLPILELTKDKSELAYIALKQFLIDNPHHDAYDRQAILLYLINFTTNQVGKGELSTIKEWFELYKLGLHQSLFTIAGYFSITTYINIVNVACRLEEYDWLKRFIKTWSPYLPTLEKEEMINFALARIAFDEKNFDDVITLTKGVPFKNFIVTLNVRLMLIRTYYEQKIPHNTILDYSNAFYLYVYRSKDIGKSLKERTLNFIKLFRHLINGKPRKMLLKELNNPQKIAICHDWLKIKINERPL